MEPRPSMRIPQEIYSFFMNPGGHSLILRGNAGTGKTTFALQIMEDLSDLERSYYVSTRVSDASLFIQFPWLKKKMSNRGIGMEDNDTEWPHRVGLNNLKGYEESSMGITTGEMSISIGREFRDIEALYDAVEVNLPKRSLVVIDSIDAMAEKYEMSTTKLINTMQKDIVEQYGANALFVLENADSQLDYLGDGVVKLALNEYQRRRIREIEILKLRGCEIYQPKYLYTLKGGRIMSFGQNGLSTAITPKQWSPIEDVDGRVSSGIVDLDRLLGGGLERGSIILIELGEGISTSFTKILEASLVSNFVSMGRGVLWVPIRKGSAEAARAQIVKVIDDVDFDRLVRIPVSANQFGMYEAKHVMAVEGSDASADLNWKTVEYSLQGAETPILSLVGFDTMESIYGSGLMDQIMGHLASVKANMGIFVGITSPSARSTERLADLANLHIKIDRIGGTIIIYGEEPFTECNAITYDERERGACVTLTQIV
jgi:KaiC/GvpD/RAD55 family RecA-like ATPase